MNRFLHFAFTFSVFYKNFSLTEQIGFFIIFMREKNNLLDKRSIDSL